MRLGFDDNILFIENRRALSDARLNHIRLHPRTKEQAYRGKADWEQLVNLRPFVNCNLYINGDITDKKTASEALRLSEADGIMVGRGTLTSSNLAQIIKHGANKLNWTEILELVKQYKSTPIPYNNGINEEYHCQK